MTELPWPRQVMAARSGHLWSNQFSGMEARPPYPRVQEQVPQGDGRWQKAASEIPRRLLAAGAELGFGFLFRVLILSLTCKNKWKGLNVIEGNCSIWFIAIFSLSHDVRSE